MNRSFSSSVRRRLLPAWPVFLALATALAVVMPLAAQKKPPREEEEAPVKSKPKKVLHIDEPEPAAKKRDAAPPLTEPAQPTALQAKANDADNAEVRQLYRALAYPHDVIFWGRGQRWNVSPLKNPVGEKPDLPKEVHLQRYDSDWNLYRSTIGISDKDVTAVKYYEQIALERVNEFLKEPEQVQVTEAKSGLTRLARLQAAEDVLDAVLGFRAAEDQRGERPAPEISRQLDQELREVRLEELKLVADTKSYEDGGYALGSRLAGRYRRDDPIQVQFSEQMARFVREPLGRQDYTEVQKRLASLEQVFVNSPDLDRIRTELANAAHEKVRQAKAAEPKDRTTARRLLSEAEAIDPRHPGLQNEISRLSNDYPILYVGVARLPRQMTPDTACTDSERQAVELMYESLLQMVDDPNVGQRYLPMLASGPPRVIPLGREFRLMRDARWSDSGEPVTAADLRSTFQVLQKRGRADLLGDVVSVGNPFLVDVTLSQGYVDPLSLMTFKVQSARQLDQNRNSKDVSAPVGSGPYTLKGRAGEELIFVANPYYNRRDSAGRPLPLIREIHFSEPGNEAANRLHDARLHLLLDLPTSRLRDIETLEPAVSIRTMPNRRIYFLAVNHRRTELGLEDGKTLRQIIANGIDRDSIIKDVFRAKLNQNREPPHRALHGPYPPGSWASSPNARRFNESIARLLASQHPGQRTLTLDYANDYAKLGENDTESKQACQQIAKQLQAFHIDVKVQPASTPEELHEKVEGTHDYQLAYYYYDYPSGAFNLWPLFDPKALGGNGTNFLGYRDDSAFTAPIQEMLAHRDFETLQKLTGQIQDQFHEKVPFIPLWQLDTHVAVHRDLKVGTIDPLRVFPGVENWKLEHSSR